MKITRADVDNIQEETFKLHRTNGSNDYLFVLFKSPSKVLVDGEYLSADRGDFIIFDKCKIQSYYPSEGKKFLHDFMHFDVKTDSEKLLLSDIPKGKLLHFSLPHTISSILSEIKYELSSPFAKYKNDTLKNLGFTFLYRVKTEIENPKTNENRKYFTQLYELRNEIYHNPAKDWSVEYMSRKVCLSRSYFQHLYKSFFSVSCTEDVINARISLAGILLTSSMLNINEIAEKCGYKNTEHFIRQFKKKTGYTPKNYRNT